MPFYMREKCGYMVVSRFGMCGGLGCLWLGNMDGGEDKKGLGRAGLPKKSGCSKFLNWHQSCMYLLSLLLPTTKGQEGEGLLQYNSPR
jgi:hypothetical protein